MIGYLFALIPFYVLVYLPISNLLSGPSGLSSSPEYDYQSLMNTSFLAPRDDLPADCPAHHYDVHILSRAPLVLYLSGFLSDAEADHLVSVSNPLFETSTVSTGSDTAVKTSVRKSDVAIPPRDGVVKCIESRALALQGWSAGVVLEKLKVQRYGAGGHYGHHFDWRGGRASEMDRVSSFMAYVEADCEGGGTEFPRLRSPEVGNDTRWGRWIESGAGGMGVTFKPVRGNAVFWENLRPDGRGYEETYHAGLPVLSGTKIGLNIWSWGRPMA